MRDNPIAHAIFAELYIVSIVLVLFYGPQHVDIPETFIIPMVFLSLLVLSVAVMAYLFFYVPLRLLLEGRKDESTCFFFKTVSTFGAIALTLLGMLYLSALVV